MLVRGCFHLPARRPATFSVSPQNRLSPFLATHTKNAPITPLFATHTKTKDLKSFICRTYEKTHPPPPIRLTRSSRENHPYRGRRARLPLRSPPRPRIQIPHRRSRLCRGCPGRLLQRKT